MAHVSIEYMILVPALILQIFLFPYIVQVSMNSWENDRTGLQVEETLGQLGSTVQQLYYTMNREDISSGSLSIQLYTPHRIIDSNGNYSYVISIRNSTIEADYKRAQIMNITISLVGIHREASTLITLGENADWVDVSYYSDNVSRITATRTIDSIWLSFEEG